ncbi:MAG: S8 family serine peptidase [Acidobacteriota bacterium]
MKNDWGFRGEGALYGAIDTGIDWSHADFQNPDGSSRILYLWDQTDPTGPPPTGFTYGTEWTQAQINAGSCTETDNDTTTWGHGTSTTGAGAGDGSSTGGTYAGHAEAAGILFVKSDLTDAHIEDGLSYLWAKAQALGRPLSVNMSFGGGWGPHDGSDDLSYWIDHSLGVGDGTAGLHLSAAAGNDTGNQQHADGAVCVSANPDNGYASDNTYVVLYSYDWNGAGYAGQPMFTEFYAPAAASLEVRAWIPIRYNRGAGWTWTYATTGWRAIDSANSGFYRLTRRLGPSCTTNNPCYDSFVGDITTSSTSPYIGVLLDLQKPMADYHNGALQYVFAAYDFVTTAESTFGGDLYYDPGTGPRPIILQFRQNGGTGSGAHVDGYLPSWVYGYFAAGTEACTTRLLSGDDAEMINGPAAAHLVTAVGAHVTKTSWTDRSGTPQNSTETKDDLASYSSHGPLRGLLEGNSVVTDQKPNLTAPGDAVVTTLSGQFAPSWYASSPQNRYVVQESPADKHIAVSGTSFSCANTAGAAALLLGADPTRTLGQIRNDLEQGARSDGYTGTVPNDRWGYGKLTLTASLDRFADLVYRGTSATALTPLHGGVGGTYTDPGAASGTELYFYSVDVPGDTLRAVRSGSDVVLTW